MNAAKLLDIVKRSNSLNKEDFRALLKLHETFPYFLVPKVLAAKYERKVSDGKSQELLHWAAVQSPDRSWLKSLIEEEIHFVQLPEQNTQGTKEQSKTTKNLQPKPTADTEKPTPQEQQTSPKPQVTDRAEVLKKLEENLNKLRHNEPDQKTTDDQKNIEKNKTTAKKKTTRRKSTNNNDLIETIKKKDKKAIKDTKKQEQMDIIKAFSKKEIKLAAIKEIEDTGKNTDLSVQSTQLSDKLLSESYAKLLTKQGKKEKAIDIYQKLSLKFPNKKAYFANLIKELKD
ncbi:hypothetical protein DN752_17485 [Echinicola strongylocentroti]|uniref:Tetratricopeptide repeat protein n=1 Tax=Echinicola strongylocentroti TaxID=1795355 RepID=A0A2Z4IMF6_9BACT|nr:hypothetical protein [Echinicola strongylocentroti]AWW31776.1 hypothetical protein DN752_17485 [Echinicola strongylocentroti]